MTEYELITPPEPPVGTKVMPWTDDVIYERREDGWYYINQKPRVDMAGEPDVEGLIINPRWKWLDTHEKVWDSIMKSHKKLREV